MLIIIKHKHQLYLKLIKFSDYYYYYSRFESGIDDENFTASFC